MVSSPDPIGETDAAGVSAGFSASSGKGKGQFGNFTPISGSAACVAPPATIGGFGTYQPFVLPEG